MKVIYIAGPYRGSSIYQIVKNIRAAEEAAHQVWLAGAAAICPHTNTALMDGLVPDKQILKGDLAILYKCDGILMIKGWETSEGARGELEFAQRSGIPVFFNMEDLGLWLKSI